MKDNDLLIQYFVNKAKNLSLDFYEQKNKASELDLRDYFIEDIAHIGLMKMITNLNL